MEKARIDVLLVELGFFDSRAAAQASIDAGLVHADGIQINKSSVKIARDAQISATRAHPYVSRGGVKLAHALDVFSIDPAGRQCTDLGASTGGFTDVLLRRGAAYVLAIDVGHGQLHSSLRNDERVTSLERTDVRHMSSQALRQDLSLVVADLSFISLEKAILPVLNLISGTCDLVALFKPQFEVGRANVGKGGIVTDDAAVAEAQKRLESAFVKACWPIQAWTDSPIAGGDGNHEHLFYARTLT